MNVRMRTQLNGALAVLALTAGVASANPSAPVIQTTFPGPLSQSSPTIQWTDATFDGDAQRDRYYVLTIADKSAGTLQQVNVPVPPVSTGSVSVQTPPLTPFHSYAFYVHANELDTRECGFFPRPDCQYGPGPESAPPPYDVIYDPDGPRVDMFEHRADVNVPSFAVEVKVHDVFRVTGIEFTEASSFSCSSLAPAGSCFLANLTGAGWDGTVRLPLSPGPDGRRTVRARFRDSAVPASNPCSFCFDFDLPGNVSSVQTVTVLLDTRKPTISLVQSTSSAITGVPVAFDASNSKDGTSSSIDSGLPQDGGFDWDFGDRGKGSGPSVSHTYTVPGTYRGTVELTDNARNVQTQAFSVTVTKPVPAPTGTAPSGTVAPGSAATPAAGGATTSPGGVVSGGATPVGGVRVGRLVRFGKYRAHRLGRVRVSASAVTTFVGALRQGKRTIQRIGVTGGPGTVTLGFIPPKAGRYVLSVTGAGVAQTLPITVRR